MSCCDRFLQNPFIRLVKRVLPLFLAIWHYADIGLDVNQSITYFEMAFNVNGSYRRWALQYQNDTNSTYLQTVSSGYFYTASVVWIGPSFLFALFWLWFGFDNTFDRICCCFKDENKISENKECAVYFKIVIKILLLPLGTVILFLFMYLFVPVMLFFNAVKEVIEGDDFDEDKEYGGMFDAKFLTVIKFIEIVGEALPQFTLNIVFITNNYPYLAKNDIYLGIPVPISIISAVFSLGSLIIGCKSGLCVIKKAILG